MVLICNTYIFKVIKNLNKQSIRTNVSQILANVRSELNLNTATSDQLQDLRYFNHKRKDISYNLFDIFRTLNLKF